MEEEKKYDLVERLIAFAAMVGEVVAKLESNYEAKTLGNQLIRSGTSPALNYAEAVVSQSKADFIYKMSICLKELKESEVALRIIQMRRLCSDPNLAQMCQFECSELVAIFLTSVRTAKSIGPKCQIRGVDKL